MRCLLLQRRPFAVILFALFGMLIATPQGTVASEPEAHARPDSATVQLNAGGSTAAETEAVSSAENVVPDYSQSNGAISVQIDDVTNEDGSVTADVDLENSRMVWYKVTLVPGGDVDFDTDGLLYDGENYYLLLGPEQTSDEAVGALPESITFNSSNASLAFQADRTLEAGWDPQFLLLISAMNTGLGIDNLPTADFQTMLDIVDTPKMRDKVEGFGFLGLISAIQRILDIVRDEAAVEIVQEAYEAVGYSFTKEFLREALTFLDLIGVLEIYYDSFASPQTDVIYAQAVGPDARAVIDSPVQSSAPTTVTFDGSNSVAPETIE